MPLEQKIVYRATTITITGNSSCCPSFRIRDKIASKCTTTGSRTKAACSTCLVRKGPFLKEAPHVGPSRHNKETCFERYTAFQRTTQHVACQGDMRVRLRPLVQHTIACVIIYVEKRRIADRTESSLRNSISHPICSAGSLAAV